MYISVTQTPPHRLLRTIIITHNWGGFADTVFIVEEKPLFSILEYRKILNDNVSSDKVIQARINYLIKLARKNACLEIKRYDKK